MTDIDLLSEGQRLARPCTYLREYEAAYQAQLPLYSGGAHAVIGGWHFPWPDGDWADLAARRLLLWTFEDSEPWVEAWTDGSRDWVIQRVT